MTMLIGLFFSLLWEYPLSVGVENVLVYRFKIQWIRAGRHPNLRSDVDNQLSGVIEDNDVSQSNVLKMDNHIDNVHYAPCLEFNEYICKTEVKARTANTPEVKSWSDKTPDVKTRSENTLEVKSTLDDTPKVKSRSEDTPKFKSISDDISEVKSRSEVTSEFKSFENTSNHGVNNDAFEGEAPEIIDSISQHLPEKNVETENVYEDISL